LGVTLLKVDDAYKNWWQRTSPPCRHADLERVPFIGDRKGMTKGRANNNSSNNRSTSTSISINISTARQQASARRHCLAAPRSP
jgi:hypothetical protein